MNKSIFTVAQIDALLSGKGIVFAGQYPSINDVTNPKESSHYLIGASAPYQVYTYTNGVTAQMFSTFTAVTANTAGNVTFTGNTVAHSNVADTRTYFGYNTYILMTDGHRSLDGLLAPFVPLVDVQVGTANGSLLNLDENIIYTHFWNGYFFHPNTLLGFFLN